MLLEARRGARHDERALVERDRLAEGVVAAHRDDTGGFRHQRLELLVESDRVDALQLRRAIHELRLAFRLHERSEHQERRVRQQRIVLVGAQHPVDQRLAVAAAAGGDQDERAVGDLGQARRRALRRHLAMQVAGVDHLLAHARRQRDAFERIADLRQAVNPDLVVEVAQRRHRFLALPFRLEEARLVHHVAQPEHQARAAALERLEGGQHFPPEADGLLVDDEQIRVENFGRVLDDRRAHRQHLGDVEVQVERRVLAVTQLDHAGHAHEVDARAEVEAADDRRARQDQDRELLVALDQRVRDHAAAAQMAEAERVMTVNEYAAILALRSHTTPPLVAFILVSNFLPGKAGLAGAAGAEAAPLADRPAARPRERHQLGG